MSDTVSKNGLNMLYHHGFLSGWNKAYTSNMLSMAATSNSAPKILLYVKKSTMPATISMKASELLVNADSVGELLLGKPYHSSLFIGSSHSLSENHVLLLENLGFFLAR